MVNSGDSGRESVVRRGLDVGQGVERDEQSPDAWSYRGAQGLAPLAPLKR